MMLLLLLSFIKVYLGKSSDGSVLSTMLAYRADVAVKYAVTVSQQVVKGSHRSSLILQLFTYAICFGLYSRFYFNCLMVNT